MRFDVVWRTTPGNVDTVLATFTHHFDMPAGATSIYDAVAFDGQADGAAAAAVAGDRLVLRFTVTSQHPARSRQFIPNGDGAASHGRIPQLYVPTR